MLAGGIGVLHQGLHGRRALARIALALGHHQLRQRDDTVVLADRVLHAGAVQLLAQVCQCSRLVHGRATAMQHL